MKNDAKKKLAHQLYISTQTTRKELAQQIGVTERTLRNWITDGNWDVDKDVKSITRRELLNDAYAQLAAVNKEINENHNGIPNKQLSDAKGVIRKEIEALSDLPLHQYISVFTEFTEFVKNTKPAAMLEYTELLNQFIEQVAQQNKLS